MAIEIERKFIVDPAGIHLDRSLLFCREIEQGYLGIDPASSVRVRLERSTVTGERIAFITVKGASRGATRAEYEYEIPAEDAGEMLENLCRYRISKTRWYVMHGERSWHVDEYHGSNSGLIMAEVEIDAEDDHVDIPSWVIQEVTGDHSYSNLALSIKPWQKD